MNPIQENLTVATEAYKRHRGTHEESIAAAIAAYMAEVFKPGELIVGEPIQPQRDYRKELWIGIRLQDADIAEANAALADFDKTFPQESSHG